MRTPALVIGWAIWCQHRRALAGCALALVVMALVYPFLFSITRSPTVVITSTIPFVVIYALVLNSLLVVEDPGSLTSSSPRHRFVFPVRTHTLVFWPMFYSWVVAALLWLATAGLIYRPSGFQTPLLLPALGMAALMAWIQAVAWLPLPQSWLRDTVTIIILGAVAAVPLWLEYAELTSPTLVAVLLAGFSALAYPLALTAVATDRRGEVWRVWPARLGRDGGATTATLSARLRPFRSADDAQFWYEWKCHGLVLPGTVGLVLLMIMFVIMHPLVRAPRPFNPIVVPILVIVWIIMPIVMASSAGPGIGRLAPMFRVKSGRFLTFVAIRPMTSGRLVAAKYRMAIVSVLLSCAVAVVMAAFWMATAGNFLGLASDARAFLQPVISTKGLALILLGAVLLPGLTWKQLTGGFACSLSGRRWIADAVVLVSMPGIVGLNGAGFWLMTHPEHLPRVLAMLPYVVVCAAILKGTVAIWAFRTALRLGLINWSNVGSALGIWLALSACAFVFASLVSSTSLPAISMPVMLLGILAFMPLSRFAVGTLALEWNRHR